MINLWSPSAGMSVGMVILTSYLLGIVHGITPDEHTWPITFSYAVGSYSAKKGLIVGLIFSLSFTVQRALMSEVSYFALSKVFSLPYFNYIIYVIVGTAMALGGMYVFKFKNAFHIHFGKIDRSHHAAALKGEYPDVQAPTPKMAIIHGFIAGWSICAHNLHSPGSFNAKHVSRLGTWFLLRHWNNNCSSIRWIVFRCFNQTFKTFTADGIKIIKFNGWKNFVVGRYHLCCSRNIWIAFPFNSRFSNTHTASYSQLT